MKSKKNVYILLPIVLLIWGIVLYKFLSFSNSEIVQKETAVFSLEPLNVKKRDTTKINVNYRDPFLGKMYIPFKNYLKKTIHNKIAKAEESIVWPEIIYRGIVSDNKNKNKVFMLIIDSKTYFMKEKDTEKGITLKRGNTECVYMTYKGRLNIIVLQE